MFLPSLLFELGVKNAWLSGPFEFSLIDQFRYIIDPSTSFNMSKLVYCQKRSHNFSRRLNCWTFWSRQTVTITTYYTCFGSVSCGSALVGSSFDCKHTNAQIRAGYDGKNFASRFKVYSSYSYYNKKKYVHQIETLLPAYTAWVSCTPMS